MQHPRRQRRKPAITSAMSAPDRPPDGLHYPDAMALEVGIVGPPSHPEYPAGHPGLNGAAATVLLSHFRRRQTFTLTHGRDQPSRTYTSIAQARVGR